MCLMLEPRQDWAASMQAANPESPEANAAHKLQEEITKDPEWGPFVEHWGKESLSAQHILKSLRNAQFDAWRRQKGYHRGHNAAKF
jgi:hypothetical protein